MDDETSEYTFYSKSAYGAPRHTIVATSNEHAFVLLSEQTKLLKWMEFDNLSMKGCVIRNVDFSGSEFENCHFYDCRFYSCIFNDCMFFNTMFDECEFENCDFLDIETDYEDMTTELFERCNLFNCNTSWSDHQDVTIKMIAMAVLKAGGGLDMNQWHDEAHECGTTHCLGGWADTVHPIGPYLEKKYGTQTAAVLLIPEYTPYFFFFNDKYVLDMLKEVLEGKNDIG